MRTDPQIASCIFEPEPGEQVLKIAMSPLPDFFATVLRGKPAQIYQLDTNITKPVLSIAPATDLSFRPPGTQNLNPEIAVAHGTGSSGVLRFDLGFFEQIDELDLPDANAVAYSHDGLRLAAGNTHGLVRVWSVNNGVKHLCDLQLGRHRIINLMFDSTGKRIFTMNPAGDLLHAPITEGALPKSVLLDDCFGLGVDNWSCLSMTSHPEKSWVAFGGCDCRTFVIDYAGNPDHPQITTLPTSDSSKTSHVEFFGNSNVLCLAVNYGLQMWDLDELTPTHTWRPPAGCRVGALKQYDNKLWVPLITDSEV